jgi:hypothetical protein
MRYKYAKTNRGGMDFILVESYGTNDGFELRRLIEKHDPVNRNIILVRKLSDGLNEFSGADARKFSLFGSTENFDELDWIESLID